MPKINLCPPSPFLSTPLSLYPSSPFPLILPILSSLFISLLCLRGWQGQLSGTTTTHHYFLCPVLFALALYTLSKSSTVNTPALPPASQSRSHNSYTSTLLNTRLFFTYQLQCLSCNCKSVIMSHHSLKTSSSIQIVGHQLQNVGECCGTTAFQSSVNSVSATVTDRW